MDFWKTMGVLLRRWYVSVPIFVVCLALAGGVFVKVPTQYESTGTIVLTAPVSGGVTALNPQNATGPGNPLLDFEGSLTITTQLLIESLSSPTVQNQIAQQGGVATYQAGDGETGGPFVVIIADANSKQVAERTVTLALNYAATELNQRQKALKAPPSTFINTQVVVAATPATAKLSGKLKDAGVVLAGGLVISLAAAFAFESRSINRRRRKLLAELDEPEETPVDVADDEEERERTAVTQQMRPTAPPRPMPQPVRSGAPTAGPGGPRPAPRPPGNPSSGARREQFGQAGTSHQPHPAKPRPQPAPVPNTGTNRGNNSGGANSGGTSGGSPVSGPNNNHREWPRTEFRSSDSASD